MKHRHFVIQPCLLLLLTLTALLALGLAEKPKTRETQEGAEPESCESSGSFWGKDSDPSSLQEFLKTTVFGQSEDGAKGKENNEESDNAWPRPFLSFLEARRNDWIESLNNNDEPDTTSSKNPFLSFVEGIHHTIESLVESGDEKAIANSSNEKILSQVLEKVRSITHKEESIGFQEFISIMTDALKRVTKQIQDNFGDLLATNIDAYIALAIPYYAMNQDAAHSPLTKRRLHRFYQTVTKNEWIDLHDALYLSHLAYVDTIEQFETGLDDFEDGAWKKLDGTTQSFPDLPASFLLIHKELDPMDGKSKGGGAFPGLEALQETLQKIKPQKSEVLVTLVVRGTKQISDLLSDGLLEPEEYRGGHAHGGILASGKNLAKKYLPMLRDLHKITKRDKIRLVIIGHSLGAGAGTIAAMELKEHDFLEVEAIGFGCPSLLSRELSESTKEYVTTVVNDADIVSRMSGSSMTNVLLDLMEYDWTHDVLVDLEFSLERLKEVFSDFRGFLPETSKALEWFTKRMDEVVRPTIAKRAPRGDKLPSVLIPPGRCIHLFRDGYGTTGTYTPCDWFSSVEFSLTLIDDHLIPTGYNRAMLSAAQDSDRDYSFQFKHDVNGIVGV